MADIDIAQIEEMEVLMASCKLVSRVPQLLEKKGWNASRLAGHLMIVEGGANTGYRMARGETNFSTETLLKAARILGCRSIAEIIDIEWEDELGEAK